LFFNIHSHLPAGPKEFVLQNLYKNFEEANIPGYYAAGLHPWYINAATWQNEMETLKTISPLKNILAIGECGLDKVCKTDFALQQQVFIAQLLWANEINKPLIIHCVRTHEALLQLLKKYHNKVPVIFHGFNKNRVLAQKTLDEGYWLSFGKSVYQPVHAEVFRLIPVDRIFLETDDASIDIQSIYKMAASIKNLTIEELSLQIQKNAATVFKVIVR